MVNGAQRFWLACAVALISISVLHAKDFADYRIGDTADDDIITPVTLDLIDANATAALKSSEALKTPAIFRSYPGMAVAVENEFLAAFAAAHSNFNAAVNDTFHQPAIDDKTIALPDFGYLLTAFNVKNKNFPVTAELAAAWARGDSGLAIQNRLLDPLAQMAGRPARPDELPAGFATGETLRLVPVGDANEKLSLDDAEKRGTLVAESGVATISHLRGLFRQNFSEEKQPLARALSEFLKPNCLPDIALTKQARDLAVGQRVVAEHYDAGQLIVRRGETIDAKIKSALGELGEKLAPGELNRQIAAGRASDDARRERDQAEKIDAQNHFLKWVIAALAGVSILTLPAFWFWMRQRRKQTAALVPAQTVKLERMEKNSAVVPADLAPYLAQVLKEAVVQGLAAQRSELLQFQQSAATEISRLVHRLDELQTPLRDRLRTYEVRIDELEKDLAARNEENRELLKIKIEMLRRQLESERTRTRAEFN